MKRIFHIIFCALIIFFVCSCSFFESEKTKKDSQEPTTTIEGLSKEIKEKIVEQDSLMSDLLNKVDTLAAALTDVKKENVELKEKLSSIESPKSTWGYMTIAAIVLSIVALVWSIIKSKGVTQRQVGEQIKNALDESRRIQKLQDDVEQLQSQRSRKTNDLPQYTEIRIQKLENTMNQVVQYINNSAQKTTKNTSTNSDLLSRPSKDSSYQRTGYANINSGNVFTKILDSAQEGCVFSIKFKNANKGEFTIISLDKIKSRNGWQEIVEYIGSIEDATNFKVEEFGVCEKCDDVAWQITKKLKIKLLK